MKNAQFFSDDGRPPEEDIGDNTEWLAAMVLVDEITEYLLERRSERSGGFEKADDVAVGEDISVLRVWREAMVGARKGYLEEVNGGIGS